MKKVSLSGSPREGVGKKDATTLRESGRIPAVIYGGEKQLHFHVDYIAMEKIVYSPEVYQIDLTIDDTVYKCVIKDMQFHPVTDRMVHIDLLEVFDNQPVTVELPVKTTGSSIGILNGGQLSMNFRKIRVKGLLDAIPEFIEVDITNHKIGDKTRIGDIKIEGCELIQPDASVVVAVRKTRVAMSLEDEELEGEEGEEGAEGAEGAEAAEGAPAAEGSAE